MEKTSTFVEREIVIEVSPEKVWKALTVPSERNKWETVACEIDLRVGGEVFFDYGWNTQYRCTIKDFTENERIVFTEESGSTCTWTLEKVEQGTKVTVSYTGLWVGDLGHAMMNNMAFGTYQFMKNLKSQLECDVDIRDGFWKSWIGITHTTSEQGTKVVKVVSGTPAFSQLQEGDIIDGLDGACVRDHDDLEDRITSKDPETLVILDVLREGLPLKVQLQTVPFGVTV